MEATVKWFNNEKGYGFIKYNDHEDIFVHYSSLQQDGFKTLSEGDTVEFCLIKTPKGYQAKYVILKTKQKVKKIVTRENIELAGAIATIASFALGFIGDKDTKSENQININCQNCEVQIVEQIDNPMVIEQKIDTIEKEEDINYLF